MISLVANCTVSNDYLTADKAAHFPHNETQLSQGTV